MKKLLYITLIALSCATVFTACSDDSVNPSINPATGGGSVVIEDK